MEEKAPACGTCNNFDSTLFRCLDKKELQQVNQNKDFSIFKKGAFLFKYGEKADKFYCIQSGLVRSFRTSSSGREQTFLIHGAGDWVGCRDLLVSEIYNHSAICMNDVEVCTVEKETFNKILENSSFQAELLKQMAKSWKESENQIFSLGTKQIHSKLAEFLISMNQSNGNTNEVTLSVTREIIASIIGTTTESVIRALSDFKARDWIDIDKNKIIFKNLKALSSISEIEDRTYY
ncbi:MAG: Crp/Fnr family transcriptional regulator [Leptospiraceae bacterium]|nr:Crp/Fnr family transcriptional regulator [Leptospiraceae bacterium]